MPTCYIKDNNIFTFGGFSSIQADQKFVRKESVFVYDILKDSWLEADFKFPIATIGSIAVSVADKILVLGGMLDQANRSSKVFLIKGNQVNNLRDIQIPNMTVLPPAYLTSTQIHFLAEPEMLLKYDIIGNNIEHETLYSSHGSVPEYFTNKIGNNPWTSNIYVYLAECVYKVLKDFNIISREVGSHSLKNIQYRDGGMLPMSDGKIFFAGGIGATTSKSTNLCFIYDPLTEEETETSNLPSPLRGLRLVEYNGVIYAVAGYYEGSEKQEASGYSYIIQAHE